MVKKRMTELVTSNDANSKRWRTTFAAGRMAYETGEYRQADTLLARAFELAKSMPEKTFAINATEIGTAAIWLAQKRTREAEARLRKSISTLEGHSENMYKELLAVALRFHAQCLIEDGDERTAENELKRSAVLLGEVGVEASMQLAYTLSDLGGLYVVTGRISEAQKYIMDVMQILAAVQGTESSEYTRADMIYKLCLPMDSDTFLEAAGDGIMKMEYFYGAQHPNIARALSRYVKVLDERGDTVRLEEAKKRFGIDKLVKK